MSKEKILNGIIIVLVLLIVGVIVLLFSNNQNNKEIDNSVKLDYKNITIKKDTIQMLKATVNNVTNANIIWETSDNGVATVDNNGVVRGIGYGTATISAKYTNKNGKLFQDQCLVIVHDGDENVNIIGVSIEPGDLILGNNMTFDLKNAIIINPDNGYVQSMVFNNSDDNVVTINDGIISYRNVGKSIITIKINNQYELKVNVYCINRDNIAKLVLNPERVIVNKKNIELYVGSKEKLDYQLTPYDASKEFVNISSNDINIAYIDQDENIVGRMVGTTSILIELPNGESESISVNVLPIATPTPTPTPEITPTPTPTPTPKSSQSSTPKPSQSSTPTPSQTNNPNSSSNTTPSQNGGRTCKISDDPMDETYNSCIRASKHLILSNTIKSIGVGQTTTIHVTLPNCGKFINYTRISAGGSWEKGDCSRDMCYVWQNYVSQSYKNESSTGYDWVITGKKRGSTCISQTVQYDAFSPSGKCSANIKSMINICINIV